MLFLSKQLIFQVEIRKNHDYSHNISAFPVRVQSRWRRRLRMRHWLRHARGNQDRRKREGIRKFCHAHIFPNIFTEKLWRPLQCVPRGRASKVLLPRNGEVQVSGLKNCLQHLRKIALLSGTGEQTRLAKYLATKQSFFSFKKYYVPSNCSQNTTLVKIYWVLLFLTPICNKIRSPVCPFPPFEIEARLNNRFFFDHAKKG